MALRLFLIYLLDILDDDMEKPADPREFFHWLTNLSR